MVAVQILFPYTYSRKSHFNASVCIKRHHQAIGAFVMSLLLDSVNIVVFITRQRLSQNDVGTVTCSIKKMSELRCINKTCLRGIIHFHFNSKMVSLHNKPLMGQ